jgi:hypothetical protein
MESCPPSLKIKKWNSYYSVNILFLLMTLVVYTELTELHNMKLLRMEVKWSSGMLISYHYTTMRNYSENHKFYFHCHENLKSFSMKLCLDCPTLSSSSQSFFSLFTFIAAEVFIYKYTASVKISEGTAFQVSVFFFLFCFYSYSWLFCKRLPWAFNLKGQNTQAFILLVKYCTVYVWVIVAWTIIYNFYANTWLQFELWLQNLIRHFTLVIIICYINF